jgi:lysophospholipase L1-like esterase
MPIVSIDIKQLSGVDPGVDASRASFDFWPYAAIHVEDGDANYLLNKNILRVKTEDGVAAPVLPETPTGNAMWVQGRGYKGADKWLVAVPAGDCNLWDLEPLDESTLDPSAPPSPAWLAALEALTTVVTGKATTTALTAEATERTEADALLQPKATLADDTAAHVADGSALDVAVAEKIAEGVVAELPRRLSPLWTDYGDSLVKPTRPGIVAIGDSITDNNHTATPWTGVSLSRTSAYRADGYLARAMALARQRCSWVDAGVSGDTTAQMLARFDTDVTPLKSHIVVEAGGTNDARAGVSAATIIANKLAMWEKAYAFGAKVVSTTIPPAGSSTTAQRNVVQAVNAWMREYARVNPSIFALVDWWPVLGSPLTGGITTGLMDVAGVHPNTLGALSVAPLFVTALEKFLPGTFDPLPTDNINDLDCLVNAPLMTGTAGGMAGNFTGSLATGWFGSSSTQTTVASKVSRTDGLGDWQQLVCSGTPATSAMFKNCRTSSFAVGDFLQASVEFETDASGWADGEVSVNLNCYAVGGSTNLMSAASLTQGVETVVLGRMSAGILQTPPIEVPTGTATIELRLTKKNPGTIRWGRHGVRKLT